MVNVVRTVVMMVVGTIMVVYTLPTAINALFSSVASGGALYYTTPTATQTALVNLWSVLPIFVAISGLVLIIAPIVEIVAELA